MSPIKNRPRVRTLTDVPSDNDAFGPHERVAQAIHDIICNEPGGKAIALSGSWGSGKSTVVRLLEKKVQGKEESLFVFDAWSHEGDPLRRSFLESLMNHFEKIGWATQDKWRLEKEEISRRREESTTVNSTGLTLYGKAYAMALPAALIGAALISRNGGSCETWGGVALVMFPVVAGLGIWFFLRPTLNIFSKRFWTESRSSYKDESFWSVLKSDQTEIVKSVTSKTADPTSIEFDLLFSKVISDVLGKASRRLVVVMDNLDRISPETALALWSTMRIFFDHSRDNGHEYRKRFWLVVPFDHTAIESLWSDDSGNAKEFAKSFIDKSFQLTFHVSPPVLSDWKKFMLEQLAEAFPDHDKSEFHGIYRLYQLSDRNISPRDIKIFINEVGELCRQWGHDVPFVLQAAYVLKRNKEEKIEPAISSGKLLDDQFKNVIGLSDWQKYMAAIHFNVDVDKAIQVLIRPDIDLAFARGEATKLEGIKSVPAFEEICEAIIYESCDEWAKKEPSTVAMTAVVLDKLNLRDSIPSQRAWQALRKCSLNVAAWKGLTDKSAEGIVKLLRTADPDSMEKICSAVLKGLTGMRPNVEGEKETPSSEWTKHSSNGIGVILQAVCDLGQEKLIPLHFRVPGKAQSYVDVLHKIGASRPDERVFKYFKSEQSENDINGVLESISNSDGYTEGYSKVTESLIIVGHKEWKPFIAAIETRLDPGKVGLNPSQAFGLIDSLLLLALRLKNPSAVQGLKNCVSQSKIAHYLSRAWQEKRSEFQASAILALMKENPNGHNANNIGEANNGYSNYNQVRSAPENFAAVVQRLSILFEKFGLIDWAIDVLTNADLAKLSRAVLAELLIKGSANGRLTNEKFIASRSSFETHFNDQELKKIVGDLEKNQKLIESLINSGFKIEFQRVYRTLCETPDILARKEFTAFLRDGLKSLTEEQWKQQIDKEQDLVAVGLSLLSVGITLELEDSFSDPYMAATISYKKGDKEPKRYGADWNRLLKFLESSFEETFIRNIVSDLLNESSAPLSGFVSLLKEDLVQSVAITEKADDIFRLVAKEIFDRAELDEDELKWLLAIVQRNVDALAAIKPSTRKTVSKRISNLLDDENIDISDEAQATLQGINRVLLVSE